MSRVKVSSKYQIVIPRDVREVMRLRKGQIVSVVPVGGVIEIVPDEELADMEGAFPEVRLTEVREEAERGEEPAR